MRKGYITVRVTEDSWDRALQALRFEIALATEYPSREYNGDRINGMRRTLRYLERAGRDARKEHAG
jgi:hypothetical protein